MSKVSYRFPPIPPSELDPTQKQTYDMLLAHCETSHSTMYAYVSPCSAPHHRRVLLRSFVVTKQHPRPRSTWQRKDGALLGPFAAFIYMPPDLTTHFLGLTHTLAKVTALPRDAREAAILVTALHHGAEYERDSHTIYARLVTDMTQEQCDAFFAQEKPQGLNRAMDVATDVARALNMTPGPLDGHLWDAAVETYGKLGAATLIQYVAFYAYVSNWLNGCAVPPPEKE